MGKKKNPNRMIHPTTPWPVPGEKKGVKCNTCDGLRFVYDGLIAKYCPECIEAGRI